MLSSCSTWVASPMVFFSGFCPQSLYSVGGPYLFNVGTQLFVNSILSIMVKLSDWTLFFSSYTLALSATLACLIDMHCLTRNGYQNHTPNSPVVNDVVDIISSEWPFWIFHMLSICNAALINWSKKGCSRCKLKKEKYNSYIIKQNLNIECQNGSLTFNHCTEIPRWPLVMGS